VTDAGNSSKQKVSLYVAIMCIFDGRITKRLQQTKTKLQTKTFFKMLLKYLFHYKMKCSKQICMLFINKLYNDIKNTGGKSDKCIA